MNRVEANNTEASTDAPFINEYKLKFLLKRLVKTLLGGLILVKVNSELRVPWYIYPIQLLVFIMPFVIGGAFILIQDLINTSTASLVMPFVAGVVYMELIFALKFTSFLIVNCTFRSRNSKNSKKSGSNHANVSSDSKSSSTSSSNSNNTALRLNKKRQMSKSQGYISLYNEEQDYEFNCFCSLSTLAFVIPPPGLFYQRSVIDNGVYTTKLNWPKLLVYLLRIKVDAVIAGLLMYCAVAFLSIVYMQTIVPVGGAVVIFVFNWMVLLITFYSLTIREPLESAIYQPYDTYRVQHYTRAFYVLCFFFVEMGYK
jgi:hypothetical protein